MRFAKNTQHGTSKVLRLPRKMTMDTSKVLRLPRKLQHIFWKRRQSIAPATQNDFRHVPEHVWMSRSATPATRNEATTRLKPPKRTTSVKLPIGTAIRGSRGRLRTVANGCERLRPQTQRRANTPSAPRPPEWNGNPCYAFGNKEVSLLTCDLHWNINWQNIVFMVDIVWRSLTDMITRCCKEQEHDKLWHGKLPNGASPCQGFLQRTELMCTAATLLCSLSLPGLFGVTSDFFCVMIRINKNQQESTRINKNQWESMIKTKSHMASTLRSILFGYLNLGYGMVWISGF